jgi:hypothetical protein
LDTPAVKTRTFDRHLEQPTMLVSNLGAICFCGAADFTKKKMIVFLN